MSRARRCALTAITRTIRILARLMVTTVRPGSRTGSLSAPAPGTTTGDIHITHAPTLAAFTVMILTEVVSRDVGLTDMVLTDMVRRFGAASKGGARAPAYAERPRGEAGPAAN